MVFCMNNESILQVIINTHDAKYNKDIMHCRSSSYVANYIVSCSGLHNTEN